MFTTPVHPALKVQELLTNREQGERAREKEREWGDREGGRERE